MAPAATATARTTVPARPGQCNSTCPPFPNRPSRALPVAAAPPKAAFCAGLLASAEQGCPAIVRLDIPVTALDRNRGEVVAERLSPRPAEPRPILAIQSHESRTWRRSTVDGPRWIGDNARTRSSHAAADFDCSRRPRLHEAALRRIVPPLCAGLSRWPAGSPSSTTP